MHRTAAPSPSISMQTSTLADLSVCNFNERVGVLTVGKDKAGNDRSLPLPKHLVEFKGEVDERALLPRANGRRWAKDDWKKSIKEAALAARLPQEATACTLLHSVITDLVSREGLDLLTVAQLSGTSVAMMREA
jgi:site-specific recombinase XerD